MPTIVCRRSRSLRAHSASLGLPAVVAPAKPNAAPPLANDDWSRTRSQLYDRLKRTPRPVNAFTDAVSCPVVDRSREPTSYTCPKRWSRREAASGVAPVLSTIASAATYTGRFASSASVSSGVSSRFTSRTP
ncbi:MAG: hypothetical protein ACJ79S_01460 [Gemmatimonadaceae bacterium]